MHVRTYGKNEKIDKKELREATKFMAGLLMSPKLLQHIWIHIYLSDNVIVDGRECRGYIEVGDETPPRKFKIYIDIKQGKRSQLLTLAHEITHVKQYATGDIRVYNDDSFTWKNEYHEENDDNYFFRPWEVESHGLEKALYETYMESKNR